MTKSIQNLFQLFRRIPFIKKNQNNIVMGRWNLEYDNTMQNRKVYWANMDHCGCCHHQIITVKVAHTHNDNDSDEYILPYIM
jgi:hypothetical protein